MSHGGGGDRWLVSYADFITLLMVLFVVLYSMGQTDIKKLKALAQSFQVAFGGGATRVVDPQIDTGSSTSEDAKPAPIVIEGLPMQSAASVDVATQLTDLLRASGLNSEVSVQNNVEGVLISLSQQLIYEPGTADLQPEAYPVLDQVIEMIKTTDNDVRVVGHTDNTPPTDPRYKDNWELSMARALTVVAYFQSKGIAPERLVASGKGEFQPIFPNDSPENRALNSRAEIILIYKMRMDVIQLDMSTGVP
ncbi:MAG TPA: flagellar motor protein MotB [Anaerolineaceae bacterium]|nr:flagellar motor protein MotB [Anaerolineaceae bacterium]HPN52806.1 flagellar motor protein MotB [Anaerolineaceae bacterium]